MIIQQNSLVSALNLYSNVNRRPIVADVAANTSATSVTNLADKVTISQEAKNRLAAETQQSPSDNWKNFREKMINAAKEDPVYGEKITREYAYDTSYETYGPLVDISHPPEIRYSHTHEIVTEENMAAFKQEAAQATAGRKALYESEKAKGTPDAEILQKLYDYTNKQPENYLSKIGWKPDTTSAAKTYDFSNMSPEHLLNTINELIKSGQMSVDETSSLIALIPFPIANIGTNPEAFYAPTDFYKGLQSLIDYSKATNNQSGVDYGEKAIAALKRFQAS